MFRNSPDDRPPSHLLIGPQTAAETRPLVTSAHSPEKAFDRFGGTV